MTVTTGLEEARMMDVPSFLYGVGLVLWLVFAYVGAGFYDRCRRS